MNAYERFNILKAMHERLCEMRQSREPMSDTEHALVEIVGSLVEMQLVTEDPFR